MEIRYFELYFNDGYSMIVKAVKEPTIDEAEDFIRLDMDIMGYEHIDEIIEWTREEAVTAFDFSSEDFWPIFGMDEE